MNVSKLLRGPEPLRTGPQPPVGGRIYDVDPAAVARSFEQWTKGGLD